jgi:hypothetical protein
VFGLACDVQHRCARKASVRNAQFVYRTLPAPVGHLAFMRNFDSTLTTAQKVHQILYKFRGTESIKNYIFA